MMKAVIFDMYETLITHFESPLYFGDQMAKDAEIPKDEFQALWQPTGDDRTIGKMTLEEAITMILRYHNRYSEELLGQIVQKRILAKKACFEHLHPEIIPMLQGLKDRNLKLGLISNCFSEEVPVIKDSVLYPYFDSAMFSYEQGVKKPDHEIFRRCIRELNVHAKECIYIGDGGSFELETARQLGMKPIQAVWYLKDEPKQPSGRKKDFEQAENPLDILESIKSN